MNRDIGRGLFLFQRSYFNSFHTTPRFAQHRPRIGWNRATGTIGENKNGLISLKPDEKLIFFNSLWFY